MSELFDEDDGYLYDEDKLGMRVTSGTVKIIKDSGNLIGISIGGGSPTCPCLYIVQVFDNTPAWTDGTLEAGDEIISVNGHSCKGSTKVEVAKMIQSIKEDVTIGYNKLHAEPKQGKTLDIILKKLKHKMIDNMSSTTADALGLSRAILCNDSLVKKLQELDRNEYIFKGLISHLNFTLKAYMEVLHTFKGLGDIFGQIGAHEPQSEASVVFTKFSEIHRNFEKEGFFLVKAIKPVLSDLNTYLNKAIPDTRLTIKKYADQKFEYLSYCLKVKEMDEEEYAYQSMQEPLYRVETGNYEYRLVLRCRQESRKKFSSLRSDVLVKLELLDQKHVHYLSTQLVRIISAFAEFKTQCNKHLTKNVLFPIDLDLSKTSCLQSLITNDSQDQFYDDDDENDDDDEENNGNDNNEQKDNTLKNNNHNDENILMNINVPMTIREFELIKEPELAQEADELMSLLQCEDFSHNDQGTTTCCLIDIFDNNHSPDSILTNNKNSNVDEKNDNDSNSICKQTENLLLF